MTRPEAADFGAQRMVLAGLTRKADAFFVLALVWPLGERPTLAVLVPRLFGSAGFSFTLFAILVPRGISQANDPSELV